jgi:hypothetical protein
VVQARTIAVSLKEWTAFSEAKRTMEGRLAARRTWQREGERNCIRACSSALILLAGGEALHLPTPASRAIQEPAVPSQWWHRRAMTTLLTSPTWCPRNGASGCAIQGLALARSAIRVAPPGPGGLSMHRQQSRVGSTTADDLRRLHCSFFAWPLRFKTKCKGR